MLPALRNVRANFLLGLLTLASVRPAVADTVADSFVLPLEQPWITSTNSTPFGAYDSDGTAGKCGIHLGEDIAREPGTEVYAAATGKIRYFGEVLALGQAIHVEHTLPNSQKVVSVYYHLVRVSNDGKELCAGGDVVKGQVIGHVTGLPADWGTGAHLHSGIRLGEHVTGDDVRTNRWFYPGYSAIYPFPRPSTLRTCDLNGVDIDRVDPKHVEILSVWRSTSSYVSARPTSYFDSFNRNDGVVGEGWTSSNDNTTSAPLLIAEKALTLRSTDGRAGIWRPMDMARPLTMTATLREGSGTNGSLGTYATRFLIGSTGSVSSGYGIAINQSSLASDSRVVLLQDDTPISSTFSSFRFGPEVGISITFETNGAVKGLLTDGCQSFEFNFSLLSPILSGTNFTIIQEAPSSGSAPITYPTIDNFTSTNISTPSLQPMLTLTDTNMVPVKIVRAGTTVLLGWNTNNGNESSCSLTGAGVPTGALTNGTGDSQTGSVPVTILAQTTFTLTCGTQTVTKRIDIVPTGGEV